MSAGISPGLNKLVNVIVCVGASVVIVGALFKIQHWAGSDILLPVGLLIEAGIFLVYAILPPPDAGHVPEPATITSPKAPAIDWDTFKVDLSKMSTNFQKLGTTVGQITDLGDVVKSTGDFSVKTKEATTALSGVSTAINTATASLTAFSGSAETSRQFHGQVQVLTKNLASINTVYELELQESNNHLKALNQFYGKLAQASSAMQSSADDAVRAKEQIAALANNLGKLNQVYGNMLTAMQGRA